LLVIFFSVGYDLLVVIFVYCSLCFASYLCYYWLLFDSYLFFIVDCWLL